MKRCKISVKSSIFIFLDTEKWKRKFSAISRYQKSKNVLGARLENLNGNFNVVFWPKVMAKLNFQQDWLPGTHSSFSFHFCKLPNFVRPEILAVSS